jgi:hypothetical protein
MDQLEAQIEEANGQPVEVLRYEVSEGTRHVLALRSRGGYVVYDMLFGSEGTQWQVGSGFTDGSEVVGFLADYAEQARLLDRCPMDRDGIESVWGLESEPEV